MNDVKDPELLALLEQLAPTAEARAELLEEHRQLEKDLLRLADPLPPPDFVHQVMQKVARAPARAPGRSEMLLAAGIVFATVLACVGLLAADGQGGSGIGIHFTQLVLRVRETVIALGSGLQAVWRTAALPLTLGLGVVLAGALLAFKRVVLNGLTEAKVV